MSDPYEDFTAEEKALLKREAKYRIEQQRRRENMVDWRTGAIVALGGLGAMLAAVGIQRPILGVGASPLAFSALVTGFIVFVVGLLTAWWLWRKQP